MSSLEELARTAHDAVSEAACNGFVMEHWLRFGDAKLPNGKVLETHASEWMEADHLTAEVVLTDDDLLNPELFLSRVGWTQHVAEALGVISPKLLKCCPLGTGPPAATRPVRRDGGGNKPSSCRQTGRRDSESKAVASTAPRAHPNRQSNARPSGSAGHTGRSSRAAVASGPNTDGVATVPRRQGQWRPRT